VKPPITWPPGVRSAVCITFDLDAETAWISRDPANIDRLVARGSFTRPAQAFPGARYIAPAESPDEADWENIRSLWFPPAEQ